MTAPKKTPKEKFNLESFIKQFIDEIDFETATPESVDAVFAKLSSLPKKKKQQAIDGIEAGLVEIYREMADDVRNDADMRRVAAMLKMFDQIKQQANGANKTQIDFVFAMLEASAPPDLISGFVAMNQACINIHNIKGDKSDEIIKLAAAEAGKLTAEEKDSILSQMSVFLAICEKVSKLPKPQVLPAPANKKPAGPGPTL